MRDKIKLKSKNKNPKKQIVDNIYANNDINNDNEFVYDNNIIKEINEGDKELILQYEKIIVIKYIILIYSLKMI